MNKAQLPLPLLVLILASLLALASTFGEWIARPSPAPRTPASDTLKQQQTAIVYVRVISWLARLMTHPAVHPEEESHHCTRTRYLSTVSALAARGTVNRAAKAAVFSYLKLESSIVQSPPMGSFTTTVMGSGL